MKERGIFEYIKGIVNDIIDSNGRFKVSPTGELRGKLSNNRIKLLKDILSLLKDTKIVTEETKIYLFKRYISISEAADEMSELYPDREINKFTVRSKIQYDKKKIERIFGQSAIKDIIYGGDIENYERIVIEQRIKYSNIDNKLKDNLLIKIPMDCVYSSIDDNSFEDFISIVAPYTKNQVRFIESNLDIRGCGYFNYLLSYPDLKGVDKERQERLISLLTYKN